METSSSSSGHRRAPARRRVLSLVGAAVLAGALFVSVTASTGIAAASTPPPGDPDRVLAGSDAEQSINGRLPRFALRPVAGVLLAPDAAGSFERMLAAAARDGVVLAVTDGYRTYDQQVDLKQRKGWLAARPGTSQHGWGVAVDFDTRVTDFAWLREHAEAFGWIHPAWAQPGGSKPEPWHWEYVGGSQRSSDGLTSGTGGPGASAVPARDVGEHVAVARFEPAHGQPGGWFSIREGVEDLELGPRHYAGSSEPGAVGNFAIAGYQADHGAPLRGLDGLRVGDLIRVRDDAGGQHLYRVFDRDELTDADGWAVGDDPLGTGTTHVMTITTGADDGGLAVVWAQLL